MSLRSARSASGVGPESGSEIHEALPGVAAQIYQMVSFSPYNSCTNIWSDVIRANNEDDIRYDCTELLLVDGNILSTYDRACCNGCGSRTISKRLSQTGFRYQVYHGSLSRLCLRNLKEKRERLVGFSSSAVGHATRHTNGTAPALQ